MTQQTDTPLLDLDTMIVRPVIEIDGRKYEILSPDEMSVLENRRFGRWAQQLEELQRNPAEDPPELEELVGKIVDAVLIDVPDAVRAKLKGAHKIAVVDLFIALLLRSRIGSAGATAKAMGIDPEELPTGAALFRAFSDSTAARRRPGWRTRLWRWFTPTRG